MKILYLRLLTACNAGCDMCGFRLSNHPFRVSMEEYKNILESVVNSGYDWIRFTGGEPLLHKDICEFVRMATERGINTSIITNGIILDRKIEELGKSGLTQLIVSIDGYGETNDKLRRSKGLFDKDINNLRKAKELGISTRVNTVVSPVNYMELGTLQEIFTELKVDMWEVTPVKLEKQPWNEAEKDKLITAIHSLYKNQLLSPMGRPWPNASEEEDFFKNNVMPKNGIGCNVVKDVRFLDVENKKIFVCNMVPHRSEKYSVDVEKLNDLNLNSSGIIKVVDEYTKEQCSKCTGCSSSALGYRYVERGINY